MIDTEDPHWMSDLLPHVVGIAHEAGSAIMRLYEEGSTVSMAKADDSPQTRADVLSHAVIVEALGKLTPDWPTVSEEGPVFSSSEREQWRYFWLIDPLDGTKEYLRQLDEFTVNIALIDRDAPILGVVCAPARGWTYFAAKGQGAWKSSGGRLSQIEASATHTGALRVLVSRSHGGAEGSMAEIPGSSQPRSFIAMGSSLKFCLVAEGLADLYPRAGQTMEWDTAAAQCVLEQAGGTVMDLQGRPIRYNKPQLANSGFLAQGRAACL